MTPKQKVLYQDLKKKYGYDIAVLKQENRDLEEDELFKALLLFHTQNLITDAINDYATAVEGSSEELSAIVTVLFNTSGEIIGQIARQDPEYLLLCQQIAMRQFNNHIKDFLDGKSGPNPLS